jgi:hypothetical protein
MLDAKYIGLVVVALFSSSMLVYTWLSTFNRVDYSVIFYAALLVLAFSLMISKK